MRSVTRIGPRQRWPGLSAGSSMLQTYALIIVDAVAPNQLAHLSRYFGGLAAVTFVGWATGVCVVWCSPTLSDGAERSCCPSWLGLSAVVEAAGCSWPSASSPTWGWEVVRAGINWLLAFRKTCDCRSRLSMKTLLSVASLL